MKNKQSRPKILITNDDGIQAPGIRYLWEALREIADLTIIAPALEQSGAGVSITIRHPLHVGEVDAFAGTPAWKVSGTPADCVKMGLSVLLDCKPDLVVSGINKGSNAGRNVFYSGTVAGVIEGVMQDVPGIAFSCYDFHNPNYEVTQKHIRNILRHVLERPLSKGTLLNVNFPPNKHPIQGMKMTRQGKEFFIGDPDNHKRHHPDEGKFYYWMGSKSAIFNEDPESDIAWLNKGYITATPVHVHELTDHQHLSEHKSHFESCFE